MRVQSVFFVSSIAYFKSNFRRGLRRVLVRFKMNFHVNNFIYRCSTIVLLRLLTLLNVDDKVWFTFIYRFYTCIKWHFPQVSIAFHKTHLLKCDTFMSIHPVKLYLSQISNTKLGQLYMGLMCLYPQIFWQTCLVGTTVHFTMGQRILHNLTVCGLKWIKLLPDTW